MTPGDAPPNATVRARMARCPEHPDATSKPGFGYQGGGFGPYRICDDCGEVFGKTKAKDGND